MESEASNAPAYFETPRLLSRVAMLRDEWRLSPVEVTRLIGASERSLLEALRAGRTELPAAVERNIRILDEIASLARGLLRGADPADWLRAANHGLFDRTPIDVMMELEGSRAIRWRLREECAEQFG